jgi:hypothetical protein
MAPAAARTGGGTARRVLRVTPARAAIAATLLVALGVTLTYRRAAVESDATRAADMAMSEQASATAPAAPPRDAVLDSAVARNLAKAQPPRSVQAAPGPAIPTPEVAPAPAKVADRDASLRVAVGRATMKAQADSVAVVAPDQLVGRVQAPVMARGATAQSVAAAVRADSVARGPVGPVAANAAPMPTVAGAHVLMVPPPRECYRVESANGEAATWGPVSLPIVVAMDSSRRRARVLTVAGQDVGAFATVTRAGADSLVFQLHRIGYEGTLALGAPGDARAGVMRSRPSELQLGAVVTTATDAASDEPAERRARAQVRKAVPQAAAPSAAARADAQSAAAAAPAVPVVARRIGCSG